MGNYVNYKIINEIGFALQLKFKDFNMLQIASVDIHS